LTTTDEPAPNGRNDAAAAARSAHYDEPPAGMIRVPGGTFLMGSDDFYPEERPAHRVFVDEFLMDPYEDAAAYAAWAGKALPTEAEWERAARGGLEEAMFTWGDEHTLSDRPMANVWQGEFPWQNLGTDGFEGTSPVGVFPPNGYGLYDMAGNVWEWTSDLFTVSHPPNTTKECCAPRNPRVEAAEPSDSVGQPGGHIPRRVLKGGSYLCAPNYCLRYRPAARQGESVETSTSHVGFRCIVRGPTDPSHPSPSRA
jgi:formylglycine-generating enzyme